MNMTDEQGVKWVLSKVYESGYRYLAMDDGGEIFMYKNKPVKGKCAWNGDHRCIHVWFSKVISPLISWEDEDPFDIGKYLGIVDWANAPVDTKVLVSDNGESWERRHFKRYAKENGEYKYVCFDNGCTLWSGGDECHEVGWRYCKLAEGE